MHTQIHNLKLIQIDECEMLAHFCFNFFSLIISKAELSFHMYRPDDFHILILSILQLCCSHSFVGILYIISIVILSLSHVSLMYPPIMYVDFSF